MLVDQVDDGRFYIAPSTQEGAGNGLFTRATMQAGDRFEVVGVLVRRDSISDLASHFADQHKFRLGEELLLIPLGFGGLVNHSLQPNLQKVFEGNVLYLEALRLIQPDEELFFTYTQYAQQRFGL